MIKLTFKFFLAALSLGALPLPLKAVQFEPPDRGTPERTTGGATRDGGQCSSSTQAAAIAPLIPDNHFGHTVAERPTLFFYIPPSIEAKTAFFSLQDEDGEHHYQTTLELPERSGVVGIKLSDAPPLEVGKNYQWFMVPICGQELEPDSLEITGWIRRIEPDAGFFQPEISLEQVSWLAKTGVWYDTISTLAQLRQVQPSNPLLAAHWEELLASVGLDAIAAEPLVN